jgi:hypothetical protein
MAVSDLTDLLRKAAETEKEWQAGTSPDFRASMQAHKALESAMEADPELQDLRGELLYLGAGAFGASPRMVVGWLIGTAMDHGVEKAIASLQDYLRVREWPARYVTALRGVQCDQPTELAKGVKIIPYSSLDPKVETMAQLFKPENPHAALVQECTVKRTRDPNLPHTVDVQTICDIALVLTLVNHSPVERGGSWYELSPDAPILLPSLRSGMYRRVRQGVPLDPFSLGPDECEKAIELCNRFVELRGKDKSWLRLVLTWLNHAMLELPPVEASINLGVALESLFLSDLNKRDRGEYRFRLSLRAAWFLGDGPSKRREIQRNARKAYDLRSEAVHTGEIEDYGTAREILKEGFAIAAQAAEKVLRKGRPNWDTVTLGGDQTERQQQERGE